MTLFPNTRRPYRPMLLISLALGTAGIALVLTGWALGGSVFTGRGYDDAFDSGFADVSKVEADISTGYVYVRPGEGYSVSAADVSGDNYSCTVEDGVLKISYDLRNAPSIISAARNWQPPTFTITVPAGSDADIAVDVGTIEANGIDCKTLSMTVKTGGVKAVLPGTEEDYRIRAGVGAGTLRTPSRIYDGLEHYYSTNPADAGRTLSCETKIGYVRIYFQGEEQDTTVSLLPEGAGTREAVSATVGYYFAVPATLPTDFSDAAYLAGESDGSSFALAQWSVGDGMVVFRMVPHDIDAGDVEEGYGDGYYEYEMTAGAVEVECIAGADGIYAARWADADYEYLIVSDRALSDSEVAAMATSLA